MEDIIAQTAFDYDMDYSDVEHIFNQYHNEGLFYEKLEEFLKERAMC